MHACMRTGKSIHTPTNTSTNVCLGLRACTVDAILVRIAPEAQKALDELDEKVRNLVRQRAIRLSREKEREFDVRLEDVFQAKDELKLQKR